MTEIRSARAEDATRISEIYNHFVLETAVTFDTEPTTPEERAAWLEQFSAVGPHRIFVAAEGGRVLGYACSHRFRVKPAYDPSVETSIYLDPSATGAGLGSKLYEELFRSLAPDPAGAHRAYAGITLPNAASVALHRRFGFRPVGRFREVGRKLDRWWDVEWYEKEL